MLRVVAILFISSFIKFGSGKLGFTWHRTWPLPPMFFLWLHSLFYYRLYLLRFNFFYAIWWANAGNVAIFICDLRAGRKMRRPKKKTEQTTWEMRRNIFSILIPFPYTRKCTKNFVFLFCLLFIISFGAIHSHFLFTAACIHITYSPVSTRLY